LLLVVGCLLLEWANVGKGAKEANGPATPPTPL